MAPSATETSSVSPTEQGLYSGDKCGPPPAKKRRTSILQNEHGNASNLNGNSFQHNGHHESQLGGDLGDSMIHPLGIKPAGNALGSNTDLRRSCGSFRRLPDELLLQLLEYLKAADLVRLGSSCKALYAFCAHDEVWRSLFTETCPEHVSWRGTWRRTLLEFPTSQPSLSQAIDCTGLFSDALYRPYFCSKIPLGPYVDNIPARNSIARLDDLDEETFNADWADKPFILTSPVQSWPALKSFDLQQLLDRHGETVFRAEAVDWPLEEYVKYLRTCKDESPLYLFDRAFAEKTDIVVGNGPDSPPQAEYWPPQCFGEDLFSVLGDQRPDCRWMIVGPARSGSTFHKDPNATSAWNAVLSGAKYWIMFPSSEALPPPPGVFVSEDQSEVTSPLSIAEWLLGYHAEARRTPGCKEGICREGEVLHVPSGWFHLVLNLETSVALTQNFVPRAHLYAALDFLKNKPDQVSGFSRAVRDPYTLFHERMENAYPELLQVAMEKLNKKNEVKKRKWDEVTGAECAQDTGGFSFAFDDDDDDNDEA